MLSVITTVLNSNELVRRQLLHLDTVLDEDCELIIIDDGSDPPLEVDTINRKYKLTVRASNDKRPWSQPCARNLGAEYAQGDRLLFFDIDHILTEDIIERAKRTDVHLMRWIRVSGYLDENGKIVPVEGEHSFHQNSFMIPKEVFEEIGGYDERHCGIYGMDDYRFFEVFDALARKHKWNYGVEGTGYFMNHQTQEFFKIEHGLKREMVVVYSALFGNYDSIPPPIWYNPVEFSLYTDQYPDQFTPMGQRWKVLRTDSRSGASALRKAKYIKLHPHDLIANTFGKGCNATPIRVYQDANVQLTDKMKEIIMEFDSDVMFFSHYKRKNAFEEAEFLLKERTDLLKDTNIVKEQMRTYREEGLPEIQLPECNVIISRDNERTRKFFEIWESEINKWWDGSTRDQLSVTYALWKSGVKYQISDKDCKDGLRALQYRLFDYHKQEAPVEVKVTDSKDMFVLMTPLHHPTEDWVISRDILIEHLEKRFVVKKEFGSHSAYLHKLFNQMWAGKHMAHCDVNTKPFDGKPHLKDYKWVFMYENDMIVTPDQIDRLLSHDVDVVSGVYMQSDYSFIHADWEGDVPVTAQKLPTGTDLIEKPQVGTGALLIKRGVMEKIKFPWFAPIVLHGVDDNNNVTNISFTGQDVGICHKIRDAGFKVHLDPIVRHIHDKNFKIFPGMKEALINRGVEFVAKTYPELEEEILKLRIPL